MNSIIERYAPIVSALIATTLIWYFRADIVTGVSDGTLKFDVMYSAIFDWSAIQTGFLFGIFGYVAGKNEGFIAEIRSTQEMKNFSIYQRNAIFLGFSLTFISIPLMVTNFTFGDGSTYKYILFCAWSFLSIWAFLSFMRVAYIFGIIVRVKDRTKIKG